MICRCAYALAIWATVSVCVSSSAIPMWEFLSRGEKVIFLHSTPVTPSSNVAPNPQSGLQSAGSENQFSNLEEKAMFFLTAYPNFSVVSLLIPASVQIASALSEEQRNEVQGRLKELQKTFKDYLPIRDTFSAMAFMLRYPHVMQMFLSASPSHDGLPLANSSKSVKMQALQQLRNFETFIKSFNLLTLLQSMGEVPSAVASQGLTELKQLYDILGYNRAFAFFLQGLTFGLQLPPSNALPAQKKTAVPIRDLAGMLMAVKGGRVKKMDDEADDVENLVDTANSDQTFIRLLQNTPISGGAIETAQQYVKDILDGVHMVVSKTAESLGDAQPSNVGKPTRN